MVVTDLKEGEGILCANPQERERIKDLLFSIIGWPEKNRYVDYKEIIFYPSSQTWNYYLSKDCPGYVHYSSELFSKNKIHELWT